MFGQILRSAKGDGVGEDAGRLYRIVASSGIEFRTPVEGIGIRVRSLKKSLAGGAKLAAHFRAMSQTTTSVVVASEPPVWIGSGSDNTEDIERHHLLKACIEKRAAQTPTAAP